MISLLILIQKPFLFWEAINHISLSIFSLTEKDAKNDEISHLSCIISDSAELAIATNKVAQTSAYLSGVQDRNHG